MKILRDYQNRLPKIWFFNLNGSKHLSTPNEIKIASRLSKEKATIFLESRFYVRKGLSELFNLNPFDIPLEAYPGKPPKLPPEMGCISISHCQDAFVFAWHKEKIGIDIERRDRKFNYEGLAKKYLIENHNFDNSQKIEREYILKRWGEIEAAIKCDHGKLSRDLRKWQYLSDGNYLIHKTKKIKLKTNHFYFFDWSIAIALREVKNEHFTNIVCNNNKNSY